MFSRKKVDTKTVLKISDTSVSFVTLKKNEGGFFVHHYEDVALVPGTIVRGEILRAEFLSKILKKIASTLDDTRVDVILPHEYFLLSQGFLSENTKKQKAEKRIKAYVADNKQSEPWHSDHVCEFEIFESKDTDKVEFTCLPKDIHHAYTHVLSKAGFQTVTLSSDILCFSHIFNTDRSALISLSHDNTRVVEFKEGRYMSHKTFEVSYQSVYKDIISHLKAPRQKAIDIAREYGFLRAHKDEKLFRQLIKSASPMLDFLHKKKTSAKKKSSSGTNQMHVIFNDQPLPGFADMIAQKINIPVNHVDVLKNPRYIFQDVLSLHRNDSYQYQAHIAQALKSFPHK